MDSGSNLHLDSNAAGTTYINYYGGTGGTLFCNGASSCSASVTGAGVFTGNGAGLTSVNAASLDSVDSSQFLRSDVADTMTAQLTMDGDGPFIKLNDNSGEDDFWLHANSNQFYILTDRDENNAWDGPFALVLNSATNSAITFDGEICRSNAACTSTAFYYASDERFKKNISKISYGIDSLMKLNPVEFNWDVDSFYEYDNKSVNNSARNIDKSKQLGFIAQDVQKVLPEVVKEDDKGYLSVQYGNIVPLTVEAIKEQQLEIETLQEQNNKQQQEIDQLRNELEQIKQLIKGEN
jgi:hypothetical protein